MRQRLSIIAAVGLNQAIGKENGLLWKLPEDMRRFRETTTGHTVIMGRNTALSLPKPLSGRTNIVLTKKEDIGREGFIIAHSIEAALSLGENDEEIFFIGGASIYEQSIPFADRLYLTEVMDAPDDADTFFPAVDWSMWSMVSRDPHTENGYDFDFVIYDARHH